MSDGTFTVSRTKFRDLLQQGLVGFDNEALPVRSSDEDAFRFGWRWSWRRMWWTPFDNCEGRA